VRAPRTVAVIAANSRCAEGLRYLHEFCSENSSIVTTDEAAFDLDLPGPLGAAGSRIRPAGRAAGRRAFFDQDRDVLSKNTAKPADPAQRAGRDRRGVLSFGYSFFAQAKKSNSLAPASESKGHQANLSICF
jgi:hypothetical protein